MHTKMRNRDFNRCLNRTLTFFSESENTLELCKNISKLETKKIRSIPKYCCLEVNTRMDLKKKKTLLYQFLKNMAD